MKLGAVIAAAVVAVGVGQAEAATVVTHDVIFTMDFLHGPKSHWGVREGHRANGTLTITDTGNSNDNWLTLTIKGYIAYDGKVTGSAGYYEGITGIVGYVYKMVDWSGTSGSIADAYDDENGPRELQAEGSFTIGTLPSPVPVPATILLLPAGLGALAMMRKRRKSQGLV